MVRGTLFQVAVVPFTKLEISPVPILNTGSLPTILPLTTIREVIVKVAVVRPKSMEKLRNCTFTPLLASSGRPPPWPICARLSVLSRAPAVMGNIARRFCLSKLPLVLAGLIMPVAAPSAGIRSKNWGGKATVVWPEPIVYVAA
jgi:hypothetical protein